MLFKQNFVLKFAKHDSKCYLIFFKSLRDKHRKSTISGLSIFCVRLSFNGAMSGGVFSINSKPFVHNVNGLMMTNKGARSFLIPE